MQADMAARGRQGGSECSSWATTRSGVSSVVPIATTATSPAVPSSCRFAEEVGHTRVQ